MSFHCELVILVLALTLHARVHSGKIMGGHKVAPHGRPYMVLLELDGETKHCGGFLLNEDFVMTAAHCQARSYKVLLGINYFYDKKVQRLSVTESFPHKDYNNKDYRNDIMLLKLSSKANFNENVRPIALADLADDSSLPKSCSVTGWGKYEKDNEHMSLNLMEVNVTLIDNENCAKEKWYCSEGETGPSKGDSGGPLVCEDGKAYGVVSATHKPPSGPSIHSYVKISDYRSWITLAMKTLKSM